MTDREEGAHDADVRAINQVMIEAIAHEEGSCSPAAEEFSPAEQEGFCDDLLQDGHMTDYTNPDVKKWDYDEEEEEKPKVQGEDKAHIEITEEKILQEFAKLAFGHGTKGRKLTAKLTALTKLGENKAMFTQKSELLLPPPVTQELDLSNLTREEQDRAEELLILLEKAKSDRV